MLNNRATISFKQLQQFENVRSASSEFENNPLTDNNITIFLKNNYRIISDRSILGQAISLEHRFDMSAPSYSWILAYPSMKNNDDSKGDFTQVIRQSNESSPICFDVFFENLKQICGPDVFNFLLMRHQLPQYMISVEPAESNRQRPFS